LKRNNNNNIKNWWLLIIWYLSLIYSTYSITNSISKELLIISLISSLTSIPQILICISLLFFIFLSFSDWCSFLKITLKKKERKEEKLYNNNSSETLKNLETYIKERIPY